MPRPPHHPDQYLIAYDAPKDELLAKLRLLRSTYLGLTRGRQEGVVQVLERLVVVCLDLTERSVDCLITNKAGDSVHLLLDRAIIVRKSMTALSSGIGGRSLTSDRNFRRWRNDCEALGLLHVDFRSLAYGHNEWPEFYLDIGTLQTILLEGGQGRTWADAVSSPGADAVSSPGADAVSSPYPSLVPSPSSTSGAAPCTNTAPDDTRPRRDTRNEEGEELWMGLAPPDTSAELPTCDDTHRRSHGCTSREPPSARPRSPSTSEIIGSYVRLGVGLHRAGQLIAAAVSRGCTIRHLSAITRWYVRSQRLAPARWKKPATVLMIRLEHATPEIPAYLGWTGGPLKLPKRKPPPAPARTPRPNYVQQKADAQAAWAAAGGSIVAAIAANRGD